ESLCVTVVAAARTLIASIGSQLFRAALEALGGTGKIALCRHATGEADRDQGGNHVAHSLQTHCTRLLYHSLLKERVPEEPGSGWARAYGLIPSALYKAAGS